MATQLRRHCDSRSGIIRMMTVAISYSFYDRMQDLDHTRRSDHYAFLFKKNNLWTLSCDSIALHNE